MAISITKYVNILSQVGAGTLVPRRDLIGRLFTTNPLVPTKSVIEFTNAAAVGDYFGTDSVEYLRAVFYFGWTSKLNTRAQKISYARWADAATAPLIIGASPPNGPLLANWTAINNGSFKLTIAGVTNTFTGLDFTGAASLAAVATIIQTAIRTGTGTVWTSATVAYSSSPAQFNFTGGATGPNTISVAAGTTGTDVANLLGWLTGAIVSNGVAIETITQTLDNSVSVSNNFASFLFIPTLTLDNILLAAAWTQSKNVDYLYTLETVAATIDSYAAALLDFTGVALALTNVLTEYPDQIPMMIMAATPYDRPNSVQNYMFQMFPGLAPSVTDTTVSDTLDAERVNYIGTTQQAGLGISFYQRGILMGGITAPLAMNVYANEIWLKDAMSATILNLLLTASKISANAQGRIQLLTTIQAVINEALNNGTISVGKTLLPAQIQFITETTDDDNAWYQVQNIGYWVNCEIVPYTGPGGVIQFKAVYTLIYSKDDVVNMVEGSHILI